MVEFVVGSSLPLKVFLGYSTPKARISKFDPDRGPVSNPARVNLAKILQYIYLLIPCVTCDWPE